MHLKTKSGQRQHAVELSFYTIWATTDFINNERRFAVANSPHRSCDMRYRDGIEADRSRPEEPVLVIGVVDFILIILIQDSPEPRRGFAAALTGKYCPIHRMGLFFSCVSIHVYSRTIPQRNSGSSAASLALSGFGGCSIYDDRGVPPLIFAKPCLYRENGGLRFNRYCGANSSSDLIDPPSRRKLGRVHEVARTNSRTFDEESEKTESLSALMQRQTQKRGCESYG